ncbi:MAG: queuosine salvage family protein [Chloroflexota bacterium]
MSRTGLFQHIRDAAAAVAARSRHVSIDHERAQAFAAALPAGLVTLPQYDAGTHYLGDPESTAAYLLALDTVNFGSGWFPVLAKRPGMSGSYTIASSLTDHFRERGPLMPDALATISPDECAAIFGQAHEGPVTELMALFAAAWNDLGRWLNDQHGGRFLSPIAEAGGSAAALCESLADGLPGFRDVAFLDGLEVPLMKRAQLLCADLSLAFGGEGPGRFHDRGDLTIFADNLVPHVLRMDGVLRYDPALADRIEREEPIPAGSREETEIRAVAVHACEVILAELAALDRPATAATLDFLLWNRGQDPAIKSRPRHRTRTIFY